MSYARIYILGSIFVLIVMGMNPFITTQGFAKISMMTTVIGAVINIILDPVFIFVFDLGVSGAAIATVLSQAVGAIWILRFLSGKKTILHLRKENFRLQKILSYHAWGLEYPLLSCCLQKVSCPLVSPPAFQDMAEILLLEP